MNDEEERKKAEAWFLDRTASGDRGKFQKGQAHMTRWILLFTALAVPTLAEGPPAYTQVEIDRAIEWENRNRIEPGCWAQVPRGWKRITESLAGSRSFTVVGRSPLVQAARRAARARRRYQPQPDFSSLLAENVFTIRVSPDHDWNMRTAARLSSTRIETVVLRAKKEQEVLQPLSVRRLPSQELTNLGGAVVPLRETVARFDGSEVRDLARRTKWVEVVVVTPGTEFRCSLRGKLILRGYYPTQH